ncbi:GL12901 [Drosophila persimilis]|uniref:GL12901 n=1 Tax=Drosophila persimilis TaxID=7234 RepID=B4GV56_DROPE|nr:GL12901 [Drosophila persimilis]
MNINTDMGTDTDTDTDMDTDTDTAMATLTGSLWIVQVPFFANECSVTELHHLKFQKDHLGFQLYQLHSVLHQPAFCDRREAINAP